MATTQRAAVDRRAGSHDKLQTLLETRTETLTIFSQLAGMRPYNTNRELQLLVQEFCEVLVDYTASAHFQLYRYIEEGVERRTDVRDLAEKIYPNIAASTRFILDFNEKYDCEDHCDNLSELDRDLSKLGEILADRFTFEDQIIAAMTTPINT
ncbi:MAG: sigma D regulator [Gammaproteobacteria bacterium]|nr:sigma D regulator [Gammaproteobacteria bacterium]MDH5651722.1 sigma D regulator [Gammaproteobacteria bacterium]